MPDVEDVGVRIIKRQVMRPKCAPHIFRVGEEDVGQAQPDWNSGKSEHRAAMRLRQDRNQGRECHDDKERNFFDNEPCDL